jgi:hypothetical protein
MSTVQIEFKTKKRQGESLILEKIAEAELKP